MEVLENLGYYKIKMKNMKSSEIKTRLNAVKQHLWSETIFREWYGCDPWSRGFSVGGQFRAWAERALKDNDVLWPNQINRFAFEQFLRSQQWTPAQFAANKFALSLEELKIVLHAMSEKAFIVPRPEILPDIYADDFLDKLPKQLPSFRSMVFGSANSYVKEFHRAIQIDLGFSPELQTCAVMEALGNDPHAGTARDILTFEHISLQFTVWLDFGKPISLRPDECSELTYVKNEDLLADYRMGNKDLDIDPNLLSIVAESTDEK